MISVESVDIIMLLKWERNIDTLDFIVKVLVLYSTRIISIATETRELISQVKYTFA